MKKLLISTSASALLMATGGALAQSGDVGMEGQASMHAAADQITCDEIAGLDDSSASQVLYYVAGYLEGQEAGTEFGAASGDQLFDDDDVAADLGTEPDDDLAATDPFEDDATSDDLAATDPFEDDAMSDDDIAATPDLDDPATDDLAATDPFEDDAMSDDDIAAAPDLDDPATDDLAATDPLEDDAMSDDDIAATAPDLDDPATDDLAADDTMIDPETTAAIGTGAEGIVDVDFEVQQVMTACADNPTMTVAAAIEQERGLGLAPEGTTGGSLD